MRTSTLTATRTKTITTTQMLTATCALALANAMALAVIPLGDKPIMNMAVQCPAEKVSFEDSCGVDKFRSVTVNCTGIETDLVVQNNKSCLTTSQLEDQAALACQEECIAQAKMQK